MRLRIMVRVGINGFGRIGRGVFRSGFNRAGFEIVAINDLSGPRTLAHLLQYDSVHGKFEFPVQALKDELLVDGKKILNFTYKDPLQIPWQDCGVDVVLECTGLFKSKGEAAAHLRGSVKKVIISAPSSDADLTLIAWGSTKGPVLQALKDLREENYGRKINFLHLTHVWPLPVSNLESTLKTAKKTLIIEGNSTAQMASLIRQETGITFDHKLLRFDGRPFNPEDIIVKVKEILL